MPRLSALLIPLLGLLAAGCTLGPAEAPASAPNRLAYVGLDEHVYTTSLEGEGPYRVSAAQGETVSAVGQRLTRWPSWSPDGARLAYLRYDVERGTEIHYSVRVVAANGTNPVRAFESDTEAPIYLSWAPDGTALTLLAQREQELHLQSLDPDGVAAPRTLATGNPLYFAWAPDSRRLLVHVNGDGRGNGRGLMKLVGFGQSAEPTMNLQTRPTDFRSPAWSPDGGRVAFAALAAGGQSALAVQEPKASEPVRLAALGHEPALLWSPTAERLAFSSRLPSRPILYRGIETIKADGSERHTVTDSDVAAFYWSPDGRQLAYAAINQGTRAFTWFVSEADGKGRRQLGSFVPNEDQLFMFAFFDQYAQSHGVWSPDGKHLVYAGFEPGLAPEPRAEFPTAPGEQTGPPAQIFVAAADGSGPPRAFVDGQVALWPVPAPRRR